MRGYRNNTINKQQQHNSKQYLNLKLKFNPKSEGGYYQN